MPGYRSGILRPQPPFYVLDPHPRSCSVFLSEEPPGSCYESRGLRSCSYPHRSRILLPSSVWNASLFYNFMTLLSFRGFRRHKFLFGPGSCSYLLSAQDALLFYNLFNTPFLGFLNAINSYSVPNPATTFFGPGCSTLLNFMTTPRRHKFMFGPTRHAPLQRAQGYNPTNHMITSYFILTEISSCIRRYTHWF
jgi:hypothetical protein